MTETETTEFWCQVCGTFKPYKVVAGEGRFVAKGSSHIVAMESSHVVARGSSHIVATSPYVSVLAKSSSAKVPVNALGDKALTPLEWLVSCGVKAKRGKAILYKSVEKDFTTQFGISFNPGTTHEAPDWDPNFTKECGCGIHYCPTVAQARMFRDEGIYVACEVKVVDMAGLPAFAEYPDKIRAKGGKSLYQVDAEGKRLKEG